MGSNNSNGSQLATLPISDEPKFTGSAEKHLEISYREKNPKIKPPQVKKLKPVEDYHGKQKEKEAPKEMQVLEEKKTNLNPKPNQKLQDSLLTGSSPSRGSVLTNPQQPGGRFGSSLNNSNTQDSYPYKPGKAIQLFKGILTEYEKGEILNYREVYYAGEHAGTKKLKGSLLKDNN